MPPVAVAGCRPQLPSATPSPLSWRLCSLAPPPSLKVRNHIPSPR